MRSPNYRRSKTCWVFSVAGATAVSHAPSGFRLLGIFLCFLEYPIRNEQRCKFSYQPPPPTPDSRNIVRRECSPARIEIGRGPGRALTPTFVWLPSAARDVSVDLLALAPLPSRHSSISRLDPAPRRALSCELSSNRCPPRKRLPMTTDPRKGNCRRTP